MPRVRARGSRRQPWECRSGGRPRYFLSQPYHRAALVLAIQLPDAVDEPGIDRAALLRLPVQLAELLGDELVIVADVVDRHRQDELRGLGHGHGDTLRLIPFETEEAAIGRNARLRQDRDEQGAALDVAADAGLERVAREEAIPIEPDIHSR